MTDIHSPQPVQWLRAGRYQVRGVLGTGGMSTVYQVWDQSLQVYRAVKLLSPRLARKSSARRRFETEARTMARLDHPNIVTVHDVGAEGARSYIVMEFCGGGTLQERVKSHGPLPPRMAAEAIHAVLSGLAAAHESGVVHRDVKPHNVLLSVEGTPRVSDFGIAQVDRPGGDLTQTGAVMGTLAYMSPEQRVNARSTDARADLYSVGVTLFFLLTGEVPQDLYMTQEDEDLGLDALGRIIWRATRYEAEARYQSAAEMLAALDAVMPGLAEVPADTPPLALPPRPVAPLPEVGRTIVPPSDDRTMGQWDLDAATAEAPTPERRQGSLPAIALAAALLLLVGIMGFIGFGKGDGEAVAARPDDDAAVAAEPAEPAEAPAAVEPPVEEPAVDVAAEEPAEDPTPIEEPPEAAPAAAEPVAAPRTGGSTSPPPEAATATGMLLVNSKPWSEVSVNGSTGRTPFKLEVPVGTHQIRLKTADGTTTVQSVSVSSDAPLRFCWDFTTGAACSR